MEIGLPDEQGRSLILKINTSNKLFAEINGLVKSASSFAFSRHVNVGVMQDVEDMKINKNSFLATLNEVHSAFGVSDEELQQCIQNKIIQFASHIEGILSCEQLLLNKLKKFQNSASLAVTMAMASEFPFIKLISPESMVGYPESAKMIAINKVLYPLLIHYFKIKNLCIGWVPIGPRFSNSVLQTLLALFKKRPHKISTTTNEKSVVQQMDMSDSFNSEIEVPNIADLSSIEIKTIDDDN
ncbi:771_t:CDS:2 [Entrophospora sp. SA101]|nr:771_t:CDS:2 [Entrophospora sp. SA101]